MIRGTLDQLLAELGEVASAAIEADLDIRRERQLGVPDLRGEHVNVGDTIAYAAVDGRSAMIRIGTVTEIVWSHKRPDAYNSDYLVEIPTKLRVEVDHSSGYGKPGKPVLIQADFKRFVKVAARP